MNSQTPQGNPNSDYKLELQEVKNNVEILEKRFGNTFKIASEADREKEKFKIIKELFDLVPSLSKNFTIESYLAEFGNHSSKIGREAMGAYLEHMLDSQSNSEIDTTDVMEKTKVFIATGKKNKIVVMDADDDTDTGHYIETPEYEEKEIYIVKNPALLIDKINKGFSSSSNITETVVKNLINKNTAEVFRLMEQAFKFKIVEPTVDGQKFTFDLATQIKGKQLVDHYSTLLKTLLNDLHKVNGIKKDTLVNTNGTKRVQLEDGSWQNVKQEIVYDKLVLIPGASNFAKNLLNSDVTDENGNKVEIYNIWYKKLSENVNNLVFDFINENRDISNNNNKEFFALFQKALDNTNGELKRTYKDTDNSKWEPIMPSNIFAINENRTNSFIESLVGKPEKVDPYSNIINRNTDLVTSQNYVPSKTLPNATEATADKVEETYQQKLDRKIEEAAARKLLT